MMKIVRMLKSIATLLLAIVSINTYAQADTIQLMKPTGVYPVGTITYEWTDGSRSLNYSNLSSDKRTIIVQIWYPAEIDGNCRPAPYSALSTDYRLVATNSFLRPSFTKKRSSSNLVIITPGRGTERFLYTTLAEDMASNGFIVASIDMPEIGYTIYGDGLILKPSKEFETPPGMMSGPYEKVDSFYEAPTEIGYKDLAFAFSKIAALNKSDLANRFTGKIDVKNVGIFGHSLGGRIAGAFAAQNKNVKAYISMEGIPPRDVRYNGKLKIPVAFLCSSGTLPYAIDNYLSFIDNRKKPVFMIELIDFGHNSVTDNPYIFPGNFKYAIDPGNGLEIARTLVTSFFETCLKGESTLKEKLNTKPFIKYKEYQ